VYALNTIKGVKKLELIIFGAIFIIGTLLGSFFSLAVHRIPLKQDITHERSYCPKCNHRLEFLDLIPILSYIFLGGKCRYCKEKIRPRYLLLEAFSGLLFLLFAISLKLNIFNIEIDRLIYLVFGMFFISTLFIIGGIEKENHRISIPVLIFGLIIEFLYIIYLYILHINIYKYVIYLFLIIINLIINKVLSNKNVKQGYVFQILTLCFYLAIGTNGEIIMLTIITTLLLIAIKQMINKIKKRNNKQIPIGFYLCFANIVTLILHNFIIIN